ncbi:MAG: relaxase domain-containing protein, partial [Nitrospinae bacterium]|nr:relaxase domain-containing protein [Nitrospinota bacterium]
MAGLIVVLNDKFEVVVKDIMVSVTNVSVEQAGTYYSKDSYYTQEQGEWQGRGAEAMGLSGEIKKEDFLNLIEGKNPQGNELVAANSQGEHRAGVDLTYSAAKTVSIAYEVLGDERVKEAHDKAVQKTISYVEKHFSQCRVTEDKITERIDTGNLIIAKFEHETSRELDPQFHVHCVVMNMTQREDGEWRALSNEKLFENKIFMGQMYRNELAASLRELGYSIQSDEKGLFEIRGIDEKLVDAFSRRSEQIEAKVKELKESGQYLSASESRLREIATLGSRVAKKDVDMEVVRETWQERIKDLGYTKEKILESVQEAAKQIQEAQKDQIKLNEYDYINLSLKVITEQESVFKKEDALKIAGRLSVERIENLEKAFHELNGDREIIRLGKDREENEVYTTKEMQKIEKEIIEKVKEGQNSVEVILSKEEKIISEKYSSLTQDQKGAVEHILTSSDRVIGVQGDAGTGKTAMLNVVREEMQDKGYEVVGLAKTGKAAEELYKGAGIQSQTIDSFLQRGVKSQESGAVFVIDESSMVGSRQMYELLSRAESQNARVVLAGDTKQLQSIEAGNIFQKLQESGAMKTVEMKEVLRQKTEEYKDIVKAVSEKEIDTAFEKLEAGKKIEEIG